MLRHDFGILFWIHLAVIVASMASPFLFGVRFIAIAFILFLAQGMLVGSCILTRFQFGRRDDTPGFCVYYLEKAGLGIDPLRTNFYIDRVQPILILFTAMLWQWFFGFQPLFFS